MNQLSEIAKEVAIAFRGPSHDKFNECVLGFERAEGKV
jgi:hypothetical protein